ncbi:hypothetical protein J2858_000809 [Neorhizobium galegae]|uniref:ATP-binding protein n=1 Tax=Neorhizobium galegae TaxID=399 RepID=UPI001AEB6719|nr:ATP-binding protein [Neorhizobium galegae]MBP2547916.1 hypothetical protein [Neorhizobium galegae]
MNKLARLLLRRLDHVARRQAQRYSHANGLLTMKIVDVDGHLIRRYAPAFDLGKLSGNPDRDRAWMRRTFAAYLLPPSKPSDFAAADDKPLAAMPPPRDRQRTSADLETSVDSAAGHANHHDLRAYAVGLVGRAGRPALVSNIVAALVLARAIESTGVPFDRIVRAIAMAAPVVSLHAPVSGFERAMRRLIELPGFLPGATPSGIDGDYVYDDDSFVVADGTGRAYIQFIGASVHRLTGASLQRRLVNALTRDYPVVAISETAGHIPSEISLAADVSLVGGWLDYAFISMMLEAIHGDAGLGALTRWSNAYDAHYLTLDDVVLAFRPGRSAPDIIDVLASLTERNHIAAHDGEDGDEAESRGTSKPVKPKPEGRTSGTSAAKDSSGGRRDKPSGAEVIQPEAVDRTDTRGRPILTVETLSGYGKAKTWALDLKADLADHRAGTLAWSQMSSKLLLSGQPGTGKTTFARALCNSLQVPLVVTSVSTWLQGGHLSDVIARMARTFAEALALAPAILFIDEIDGIGKRQPAEREYADYWNAVVNKALELLDGAVRSEGLVIVGATNRPDDIDGALKRSGRLETHIDIPKPDVAALAEIFAHHLGDDIAVLLAGASAEGQADAYIEGNDTEKGART